jgi:hypothetical protein
VPWLAAFAVVLVAPKRARSLVVAMCLLFATVLILFALVPMAPPWMTTDDVVRVIQVQIDRDISDLNQVAAMPSMHVALPTLIALWMWREGWRKAAALLAAYTAVVSFEVVVSGEHYVVALIGAVLVAAVVVRVASWFDEQIEQRRERTTPSTELAGEGQRGQNLIEFAMLMPFVIVILAVIVMIGLGLHSRSNLQQAMREGARQAAVVGVGGSDPPQAVYESAVGNSGGDLENDEIKWCRPGATTNVGDQIRVFIDEGDNGSEGYSFTLIPIGGIFSTFGFGSDVDVTMKPRATARLEKSISGVPACT